MIIINLSTEGITKTLIRLHGCAGWSASLLFAYSIRQVFSWRGSFLISSPARLFRHIWCQILQHEHIYEKSQTSFSSMKFLYFAIKTDEIRPTIKKILFSVTRPTQKNCPYPKKFIGLPEKDFFISRSQIHFFNFFSISLQKCSECAVVNRGATEREMNWNKCHSLL